MQLDLLLTGGLVESSNVAMSQFGTTVSPEVRQQYLERFGVGGGDALQDGEDVFLRDSGHVLRIPLYSSHLEGCGSGFKHCRRGAPRRGRAARGGAHPRTMGCVSASRCCARKGAAAG